MLENGMIVGAESCDPQCREPQKGYCVQCKQMVPVHELTEFANGERVCDDCLHDYLEVQGADFVNEYIRQNEWEFYGSWWFNGLDREEQLRVILYVMTIWKVKRLTFAKKITDFCSL